MDVEMGVPLAGALSGLHGDRRTVIVEASVRYGQLCQWLHRAGYALQKAMQGELIWPKSLLEEGETSTDERGKVELH
jgi:hypothetical protein